MRTVHNNFLESNPFFYTIYVYSQWPTNTTVLRYLKGFILNFLAKIYIYTYYPCGTNRVNTVIQSAVIRDEAIVST